MRKYFALCLAALLVAGAGTAHAGGYRDYGWRDHHYRDRPHRDAYLVGGLLLGLAAGAALADRNDRYWRDDWYADDRDYGWRDRDRYWYGDYGYRYGHGPRYGREVVVYREVRRPVYRERVYHAPPPRYYRYRYRGW